MKRELAAFAPDAGTIKKLTVSQANVFAAILATLEAAPAVEDEVVEDQLPEHDMPPVEESAPAPAVESEPAPAPVIEPAPVVEVAAPVAPPQPTATIDPIALTAEAAQKTERRQTEVPYLGRRVYTAGCRARSLAKLKMAWEGHVQRHGRAAASTLVYGKFHVTSFFDCDEEQAKEIEAVSFHGHTTDEELAEYRATLDAIHELIDAADAILVARDTRG